MDCGGLKTLENRGGLLFSPAAAVKVNEGVGRSLEPKGFRGVMNGVLFCSSVNTLNCTDC